MVPSGNSPRSTGELLVGVTLSSVGAEDDQYLLVGAEPTGTEQHDGLTHWFISTCTLQVGRHAKSSVMLPLPGSTRKVEGRALQGARKEHPE